MLSAKRIENTETRPNERVSMMVLAHDFKVLPFSVMISALPG